MEKVQAQRAGGTSRRRNAARRRRALEAIRQKNPVHLCQRRRTPGTESQPVVYISLSQPVLGRRCENLARVFKPSHAEDWVIQDVDGINPELQPALPLLANREVLLQRQIEELLPWAARVIERARRIAELPLHGPHEGCRIEVRFAQRTRWATWTVRRVEERDSGNEIRADGACVARHTQTIVVTKNCHQRQATLNTPDATEAPVTDNALDQPRSFREEPLLPAERQVVEERRAKCVFDVEQRNRAVGRSWRAEVDVARRAHIQVDEPDVAGIRRLVNGLAVSVVRRVGQPPREAAIKTDAHG